MIFSLFPRYPYSLVKELGPTQGLTHWLNHFNQSVKPSNLVEVNGIEPMTSCVQGRRSPI